MKAGGSQVRALVDTLRSTPHRLEVRALSSEVVEIDLYGEIGFFGITAKAYRDALKSITAGTIVLNINSPGGDVFDGVSMYNDTLAHGAQIVVRVTGLAASAASIVAMAGDEREIAQNAFFMIHNAWTVAVGDRRVLEDRAKVLSKIDAELAGTYAAATGIDAAELTEMMDAETWLSAAEAVDLGFADKVIAQDAVEAAITFDLSNFKNVPRHVARVVAKKPSAETKREDFSSIMSAIAGVELALAA